jgi:hypothetical protein
MHSMPGKWGGREETRGDEIEESLAAAGGGSEGAEGGQGRHRTGAGDAG